MSLMCKIFGHFLAREGGFWNERPVYICRYCGKVIRPSVPRETK